jgi:hypothetical protein
VVVTALVNVRGALCKLLGSEAIVCLALRQSPVPSPRKAGTAAHEEGQWLESDVAHNQSVVQFACDTLTGAWKLAFKSSDLFPIR